jgi:ATP-binding protein involved in chromosome partitioning
MEQEPPAFVPTAIAQRGPRALTVTWADGHESVYDVRALRLACACAECVDEWTGEETLDAARVPEDVRPRRIQGVGRYAIQIDWSDGHTTGIYPFRRLRGLCSCPACRAAGPPPEPGAASRG